MPGRAAATWVAAGALAAAAAAGKSARGAVSGAIAEAEATEEEVASTRTAYRCKNAVMDFLGQKSVRL